MTPAETHAAVLAGLAELEDLANAAQPDGAWYQEGRDVCTSMPLLSPTEMAKLHPDEFEDWVFTAATRADAAYITTLNPARILAQLAGRRRIIERHAPVEYNVLGGLQGWFCRRCSGPELSQRGTDWPCDNYRDAAADLLTEGTATT